MVASATDWSTFAPDRRIGSFEHLIGEKLRTTWDAIAREQLPAAILEAIDALFEPPVRTVSVGRNFTSTKTGWARLFRIEILCALRVSARRRQRRANQRMVERAIRKQGVAWLTSVDSSDFNL